MTEIERLLAIEEIKQLKARYFRCLDTKEFAGLHTVFADESTFDFREALRDPVAGTPPPFEEHAPVSGREAIVSYIGGALETAISVHHGHMPEIELTSDTTARGIWPMEDVVKNGTFSFRGWGHYRETYVRTDQGWRIATSQLTRLRVDIYSH